MRKLNNNGQESLDLLLDTLCNVFGGIILIACLLAILGREQAVTHAPALATANAAGVLLEHRITAAQEELAGLQKWISELDAAGDKPLRELAAKRDALRKTVDRLRKERAANETQALQNAASRAADPGVELAKLRLHRRDLAQQLADQQAQAEAAVEKQQYLHKRLEDLARELQESEDVRVVKLRLPKERPIAKRAKAIILKFGEVFPLYDAEGHAFAGVRHESETDDGFVAMPQRDKGLSPSQDVAQLRTLFAQSQLSGRYLTFYIYPDSFETFRALKPLIHQLSIEYGVEVCKEGAILNFGAKGTSPSAL